MITTLLINKIIQLFIIMLLGYVVVKAHILSAGESMILSKLSLYLIMPCVILNAFQVELTDEITQGLILAFIAAILIHIVLIGIGGLCGRVFHANVVEKASIVYSNAGNLIIPIVTSVLGPEWVIYSSAFLSVQLIFIWSHGVGLFSSGQKFHFKKILLNANMISIFVGMLMLICRIKLPPVISEVTSSVGSMIGPISMIIAGMLIANMDFKQVFFSRRIYFVLLFRMVVCPAIMLLLIAVSGAVSLVPNGERVLLITFLATMTPAASTITQFAQIHHQQPEYASAINIITTLSCIVTMPVFVWLYTIFVAAV